MQKNYRLILVLVICITTSLSLFAQDAAEYKDVVLDGKPARLNVATGEITLINLADKKEVEDIEEVATATTVSKHQPRDYSNLKSTDTVIESDYHVVQKGDNLLKLSERFKVSLRDLKNANNLETTLIHEGQKLRVKNFNAESSLGSTAISNLNSSNTMSPDVHLVKKGETLYGLSKEYGMTVSELKQRNNLSSNLIKIGQTLNISNLGIYSKNTSVWTVIKGDTLYSIARKNGTTVDAIKELNGLTSNLISIGQKLQLK